MKELVPRMILLAVFLSYIVQMTLSFGPILSLPLLIISSVYPIYNRIGLILSILSLVYLEILFSPADNLRIILTYALVLTFLLIRQAKYLSTRRKLIDGVIVQIVFLFSLVVYPIHSENIWIIFSVLFIGVVLVLFFQTIINMYFREPGELNEY